MRGEVEKIRDGWTLTAAMAVLVAMPALAGGETAKKVQSCGERRPREQLGPLFQSAESFIRTWDKACSLTDADDRESAPWRGCY